MASVNGVSTVVKKDPAFNDRKMLYKQTRDYIMEQIRQGVYGPGEMIPPERELAEQLKISRYTVRRAIEELVAERVLERVQGSGTYVTEPPSSPRRSNTIGIVMPFSDAEVEMLLLNGMQRALSDTRFSMTIRSSGNSARREWEEVQRLKDEGVSGLIIMPSEEADGRRSVESLKAEGFPFVLVDRKVSGCETNCVMSDNIYGGYISAKRLYDLGHRNIAFIKHRTDNTSSAQDRFLGYRRVCQEKNLGDGTLFAYDFRNGEEELRQFLLSREYTACIAVNGYVAADIVRVCRASNLEIPRDLSLISFDDPHVLKRLGVSLTVSGQFKMDINGHEKSPQHGRVKEEKSSPTRIGLVTTTNLPIRGVSKLEESGDHCEYKRVPRSRTDQASYSSALRA